MQILVYSVSNIDGTTRDGERVTGVSIKGIQKDPETHLPGYFKEWVDATHKSYNQLKATALSLIPGQVAVLEYAVEGRKAVISNIIPGELVVDFDVVLIE